MPLTLSDKELVVDRNTHTIIITRTLAASCEQAFEAWTRPEHVTHWWDPTGEPLEACEIDLRPGGAFLFAGKLTSGPHQFAGVYREITPPRQLVFEAMGAIGRVNLDQIGEKTRLTVSIQCGSQEHLDQYLNMGVDTGTAKTIDNLVAYLDAPSARTATQSDTPGLGR